MHRRAFLGSAGATLAAAAFPAIGRADVSLPTGIDAAPPTDSRAAFVAWMTKTRGEDAGYLGQRWDRLNALVANKDVWDERTKRAYLMTPREEFVTRANLANTYQVHYLDIGFGVTITGPHTVARMTNTIDVKPDDKVLEIGTGSGYQSAVLSHLTDKIWTIEIIKPLFERTGALYESLIGRGYSEYRAINRKNDDGYYGWEAFAPFDKIIVTCGIDHVPPPLLQQMRPGGIMVIPVGPPGSQHVLKIVKQLDSAGAVTVARSDIYGGSIVNFVPFTKLDNGKIVGTHSGGKV
ncbi:MAG: protein-L-isoaspartate O-methyltransferase [Bauldia sp.]